MTALLWALFIAISTPRVEVQGHRGARAVLPENSLVAFEYAVKVGVDTLELDVGVSKDGVLVVNHEPFINPARCIGADGRRLEKEIPLASLTRAQIQTFDCGLLPNVRFPEQRAMPGTKIPTLAEVFELVRTSKHPNAKSVHFNIETKIFPAHPELTPSPEKFAALVVDVIRKHDMVKRSIVQSFDYRTLAAVKKIEPKLRIAMLQPDGLPPYVALAQAVGAEIISPHHEWITKAEVDALHAINVRVIPWTANDSKSWERLLGLGVDGIITDDPAALITFLKKKRRR